MEFYTLRIKEINKETRNAVSIVFDLPEHLRDAFSYSAGQYLTLKTAIDGQEIRRDYSLCANPNEGDLKVVVKAVENGVFSQFANTLLKVGDELEVATPNGRFTYNQDLDSNKSLMLFAAGSGITPIMSILKTALESANSKVTLVYGNKSVADTIFYNDLNKLKDQFSDRFELEYIFSQENNEGALFGRIEGSTAKYMLNRNGEANLYYICGPEAMIHEVNDTLLDKGVSKDNVKFELFTVPIEDAIEGSVDVREGEAHVSVLVDDEEVSFTMQKSNTILEAALKNNVDAPYSCQGGICSSCIARLTEGEASMRQNNILTDGEIAEGLILTCQAQPTTSKIAVDYDDV